ncbi:MAG: restriction endonuclease subunit S [Balneolaceae bacterium]|nr:restriction endonuclease subunit S [Balneolaceae bacterium]
MEERKVPMLRFPEFEVEWELKKVDDVFSIFNGFAFSSSDSQVDGCRWIKIADVGINQISNSNLSYLPTNFREKYSRFLLKTGDYVIALTRPILNGKLKIARISEEEDESLLNQRVGKLLTNGVNEFVYNLLQKSSLIYKIESNIAGTDPPNLSTKDISTLKINVPQKPEQQKIASFLSAVDKKIEQLTRKKELLEQYKKGVMQKLFTQEIRFRKSNGDLYPDWKKRKLADVLFEHKNKSDGSEEVFSVSVHKGLINQIEHLGRSFAASTTDHYNQVQPFDIVYTKSPTGDFPYGIIKQSKIDKNVIVSPLYGVFTPETKWLGRLLDIYFESPVNAHNYLHSIIQKGAKNTINITNTTFLSKSLNLPVDEDEQEKVGLFLESIEEKIIHVEEELEKAQTFKKGLLQQMFV